MTTTDVSLSDAQYRLVAILEAWSRERPGESPSNRALAERCGWLCRRSGKPNVSKVKANLEELEAKGVLSRGLERDGRQVRRVSITLKDSTPRPGNEPPTPDQIQATPGVHWIGGVRDRVRELLSAVASEGPEIDPDRLRRVAEMVQTELAGNRHGNASSLMITIVEAVANGYSLSIIETAIMKAGEARCPRCRADIRHSLWRLTPDPRGWLQARGLTLWSSRTESRRGWYA
jgi:hypothetical protein